MKQQIGKLPPQDKELERAVIGACMLERDIFQTVLAIITSEECFYVDTHQHIYAAMLHLMNTGVPIDLLTITDELRKREKLDICGGAYELTNISMDVLSTAHVEAHARIVMEKYMEREIIKVCTNAVGDAYSGKIDVFDLIDTLKHGIEGITKDVGSSGESHIGRLFIETIKELEYQKNHRSALTGVDTGLYDLNELTNGWQKSDLIIIGGRPSKGKTALGLNLALSAAISTIVDKVPVGIFSLEMGSNQLVKRMVSTVTGIDFGKVMTGNVSDVEFANIVEKSKYFHNLPIRISDKTFTLIKIIAQAKKWVEKYGVGLIVIDYLQLIKTSHKQGGNREQEVSGITRDLKLLAKELNVPIILLSQLNRGVEARTNAEPQPSDLRESGAIEQDADVILFPWHGDKDSFISVAKNRNGKTAVKDFALKIKFSGSIQKWMDIGAFEPFKAMTEIDNPRSGITNNYQNIRQPYKDTEEFVPF